MRQAAGVSASKSCSGTKNGDQGGLPLSHYSFADHRSCSSKLLRRRAFSPLLSGKKDCSRSSSSPQHAEKSLGKDECGVSRGGIDLKCRKSSDSTATPLLGRYRINESTGNKTTTERMVNRCVREDKNSLGSTEVVSPTHLKGRANVATASRSSTECAMGQRDVLSNEPHSVLKDSKQQHKINQQKMVSTCCSSRRTDAADIQRIACIEGKKITSPRTSQICPDTQCIHGRQGIIDYVSLQRELRECYAALQDRDAELDKMRSQLQLVYKEKADSESRYQLELQEIENRYSESLAKEREEQMEWQRHMLSDQLATYKRDREDLDDLRTELEQERLNHAKTKNELDKAKNMCHLLEKRLEFFEDVSNSAVSLSTKKTSPAKSYGDYSLLVTAHSHASTITAVTPRRQPPLVPQPVENEEVIPRKNLSFGLSTNENVAPASGVPDKWPTDVRLPVDSTLGNSTIDVSDPSIAFFGVFDADTSGSHPLLVDEIKPEYPLKGQADVNVDEFEGAELWGCGESTKRIDQLLGCSVRSTIKTSVGVQTIETREKNFSACSEIFNAGFCHIPEDGRVYHMHPFESLAGQEALLCKELLRALLLKEKQLAELNSEHTMLKNGERNSTFLSGGLQL